MARFEKAFPWLLVGGAALVLLETYRKNTNDRAKANADIKAALKNQEHQAEVLKEQIRQFDENAFKERKAERRERYTKAVEQLGSKEAPVRLGGVYTLVGLVDEWLEEQNLEYSERLKEGQVIINNLCAYIRFPFTLASYYDELSEDKPSSEGIYKDNQQKFYTNKAEFKSEADIRLSIIKEIHSRLQSPDKNTPGVWSGFEYDFSGSTFFYPVDLTKSYYTKPVNFSGSTYQDEVRFDGSVYKDEADFGSSIYKSWATFDGSTYTGWVGFNCSTYQSWADFSASTYQDGATFMSSTYQSWADFSASTYQDGATFMSSTYQSWADFSNSTYQSEVYFSDSTYKGKADFCGSTYQNEVYFSYSTYQSEADFSDSICQGKADFSGSTYRGWADFRNSAYQGRAGFTGSTYQSEVYFNDSTYQWAHFSGSTYRGWADFRNSAYQGRAGFTDSIYQNEVYFSGSTYEDKADFSGSIFCGDVYYGKDRYNSNFSRFTECTPQFYNENSHQNTLFGSPNNNFIVDTDKGYPINLNSEGLPLGCDFLTAEQKEYLEDKFHEIDETKNKFREVKDPKEKAELSKNLQALDEKLYEWREEATTVKAEDNTAPEKEDN
ncbi:hypothetical protein [Rothia sp. HSID18067]|uniref:hypothetical protein n=1 Tax=Rothia sp. HSID18067 TaxID=2419514 RepID=UPI001EE94ED2|nr:hypothetical protein [Rothia sp. HSID18067]